MADDEARDVAMAVFMSLCPGATVHQAQSLLERHQWDPEVAAAEYVKAATAGVPAPSSGSYNNNTTSNNNNTAQPVHVVASSTNTTSKKSNDNNNKKPETYYAGGASSGVAIMNPNDNNNDDDEDDNNNKGGGNDFLKALFESAKAAGGVEKQGLPGGSSANDGHVQFGGVGRRLGYTEGGQTPASAPVVKPEKKVVLTTYKNGYVLGDDTNTTSSSGNPTTPGEGELRPYDEKGKRFMTVISKGFLPPELSAMYPGAEISIALVDRSKEEYVQKWKPFSGQGHKLQADTTTTATTSASASNIPPPTSFELREDEKKAKVALLLPSGSRVEREVNPDRHTVNDIRFLAAEAINTSSNNNSNSRVTPQSISLTVRTLPPRPLHNLTDTIATAKASGCVILVKTQ